MNWTSLCRPPWCCGERLWLVIDDCENTSVKSWVCLRVAMGIDTVMHDGDVWKCCGRWRYYFVESAEQLRLLLMFDHCTAGTQSLSANLAIVSQVSLESATTGATDSPQSHPVWLPTRIGFFVLHISSSFRPLLLSGNIGTLRIQHSSSMLATFDSNNLSPHGPCLTLPHHPRHRRLVSPQGSCSDSCRSSFRLYCLPLAP